MIQLKAKPLSVNKAWQGRRFKTDDYLAYEQEIFFLLPTNFHVGGKVQVDYRFYIKNVSNTDVSNLIKLLEDIMVKKGIIDDDRYIYRFTAEKFPTDVHRIEIDVTPYAVECKE